MSSGKLCSLDKSRKPNNCSIVDAQISTALTQLLAKVRPESVLVVSPTVPACIDDYAEEHPKASITHFAFDELDECLDQLSRYDFAFVADTLENLEVSDAELLVARLRDLHAKLLWVSVPKTPQCGRFGHENAVAQGMRKAQFDESAKSEQRLYEFSLQFYKPVPQWLNAENWANPQQWNKRRW